MRVLHIAAAGTADPTRASIPLHIAANGSVEEGQDCAVVLVGDATELVARKTAEELTGIGIPPAKDLLAKLVEHGVPVYV
jgi:predicted peroxiredoxin